MTRNAVLVCALTLGTSLLWTPGCRADADPASPSLVAESPATVATTTAELTVVGMTCASCVVTIKIALGRLDGVASVEVDSDAGTATVQFDHTRVSAEQIAEKVTDSGYDARVTSTQGV